MAGQLGKFQMVGFDGWKGLSKLNHISAIYGMGAQKASNMMVELLASKMGNTLDTFLSRLPIKEFEDDSEYYWDIISSARKNIPLVEARDEDGKKVELGDNPVGVGTTPFYLVFAEDYFADGEVIFGSLNQVYPIRVLGDARMEGTNAVYRCEVMGGITTGVPSERLQAGERFSVGFAPVEKELSRKVGDIRFNTPVSMRNEWTTIRLQHKVSGAMLNRKLAVGIPMKDTSTNKTVTANLWMHNVDWTFEKQWSDYKNIALAWGTSNRNTNGEYLNFGKSGEAIRMGDGLFAQMEVANTYYYNTFSLKMIEDALYELSANALDIKERVFVLRTGMRGASLFSKAVGDIVSGWTQFTVNADNLGIVQKTNNVQHQTSLAAGYQFTEFRAPNGVVLKIEVDKFYDDPVQNKIQHPLGGPASSYRFDIMDIGSMDQPNIFKCQIKGEPEYRGYQSGMRNPFTGAMSNDFMSHDEDSATIHKMTTFGVCVLDPTRTMSFIPAVLQG